MNSLFFAAIRRPAIRFSREKRHDTVGGEAQDSGGKTKANQEAERQQKPSEEVPWPQQHTT